MILVADAVPATIVAALREHYRLVMCKGAADAEALDRQQALDVRALVTPGGRRVSRAMIEALPRLGLIACIGAGFDGIDLVAAADRGIQVTNSPGAPASSVADVAVGLLIASRRQIVMSARSLQTFRQPRRWPATAGLTGARAGIYGYGAIGRKVAARLAACEMEMGYFSRSPQADSPHRAFPSLRMLAQWADALIVCVPATSATVRSVDAEVLHALGADGHLVNIARASIVDADALYAALQDGSIAGAALDVVAADDLPRLLDCPNVLITPHIAGCTHQAEAMMCEHVLRNVAAFLAGHPVRDPVPRENQP